MVKDNYGKIPPQEPELEEAVLGALMLESEAYQKVSSIISSESFYFEKHQIIFNSIKKLSEANHPVDIITITGDLKAISKLESIGGPMYLIQLTNRVASAAHIEHHARIIQQKFIQRELIRIGSETTNESFQDGADIEEILNNLKLKISDIENYSIGSSSGQIQSEVLNETIIEIEKDCRENEAGRQPGITTGLFELNMSTGGWRKTNLIILFFNIWNIVKRVIREIKIQLVFIKLIRLN
jgi:replicative DNA helicase